MKKKRIYLLVLALVFLYTSVFAQGSGFGMGIIIGEPTGLSLKNWLDGRSAFDVAVAWSFGGDKDAVHLHADYLLHNFDLIQVESGSLPVYFGIGGRVKFEDDPRIGVRIPVGLDYLFADAPLDLFIEAVPMLDLAPDTHFDLNAGLGMRYFF